MRGITTRPNRRRVAASTASTSILSSASLDTLQSTSSSSSSWQDSLPGDEHLHLDEEPQLQELQDFGMQHLLPLTHEQQEKQQQLNVRHAALRSVLEEAQLSISAIMAVLRHSMYGSRSLNDKIVRERIRDLQEVFGAEAVNAFLSAAPQLLLRSTEQMIANYEGLSRMLGAGDEFARELVVRCPDLLGQPPGTMQTRLEYATQLLQVSLATAGQLSSAQLSSAQLSSACMRAFCVARNFGGRQVV
jgi:hypothetical protein